MNLKVKCITLRTVNYKDSDKIITLFTLEKGKIAVSARGVRKANARMKAIAEPFCLAEAVLAEKSGRYTVTEVEQIDGFYPVRTDVTKYFCGLAALEFTDAFLQDEMFSADYFSALTKFLSVLSYGEAPPKVALAAFLGEALALTGYAIDFSACSRCGGEIDGSVFLSGDEDLCVCGNCKKAGDRAFSFDTYRYLRAVSGGGRDEALERTSADNGLKFFAYYIKNVAGVELKSLAFGALDKE